MDNMIKQDFIYSVHPGSCMLHLFSKSFVSHERCMWEKEVAYASDQSSLIDVEEPRYVSRQRSRHKSHWRQQFVQLKTAFLKIISSNLKIISDSRIRSIIARGPKYRFPVQIYFQKSREKIAASLNELCNSWCKREHVECDALKDRKLNICKIRDQRILSTFKTATPSFLDIIF